MRALVVIGLTTAAAAACAKDPAPAGPPAPDAGATPSVLDVVRGLELYSEKGCAGCHCNRGEGGCNVEAPAIQGASFNLLSVNLRAAGTEDEVPGVPDPWDPHPAKHPGLSDVDVADLAGFLASLDPKTSLRDESLVGRGYQLYVTGGCITCHLMSGQGTSQGGIGTAIAGVGPDNIYAALSGQVPCHPMQRQAPPPGVSCSVLSEYIIDNPVVAQLTDTRPPEYDEERALLSYFLAFISPPPSGGVVEPCNEVPGQICTIAGNGIGGFTADDVEATKSLVYAPMSLRFTDWDDDGHDDLIIVDWNNQRIRMVNLGVEKDGVRDKITTLGGSGRVTAPEALNHPTDVVFDASGAMIIAGWHNQIVYRYPHGMALEDSESRELLGGRCALVCPPNSPTPEHGDALLLGGPVSVAYHPDGRIFVAENSCGRIRAVTLTSTGVTEPAQPPACPGPQHYRRDSRIITVAGAGPSGYEGDGGPALLAKFNPSRGTSFPNFGIALEPGPAPERLYIADSQNNVIRYVNLLASPPTVHLFAGRPGVAGLKDGPAREALFKFPTRVWVDAQRRVWVADARNNAIRRIDAEGTTVETVVGDGRAGFNGDNIPARQAQLNNPNAMILAPDGRLFIADTNNHRVRVVYPER